MPVELKKIQTAREIHKAKIQAEISKLKSGYGLTYEELAKICGIGVRQIKEYRFHNVFNTETLNGTKYFVK